MKKIDVLNLGYVGLVSTMGNDLEVANSARVSFDKRSELNTDGSINKKDQKLIDFLWKEEHTSPFRHCVLSFEIYAPLMVARQHWKYAVASTFVDDQNGWNESSRRYITEEPAFYLPTAGDWRSAPENSKQGSGEPINYGLGMELTMRLFNTIEAAEQEYQHALDLGVCAEQARLFLPAYGMYVRYRWTTSLHGIMHFLQQRLAHDAQKEITDYALAMKSLAEEEFPYCIGLIE
jgi:thymidylate synthase (FAD)